MDKRINNSSRIIQEIDGHSYEKGYGQSQKGTVARDEANVYALGS
jgi:hypothetical protein